MGCGFLLLCAPIAATGASQNADEARPANLSQPDLKKLRKLWFKLCLEKDDRQEARRLLDAGMDLNMLFGSSAPLHEAIRYDRPAIVEEALKYGADPDKPVDDKFPLELAIRIISPKIVKLLLAYGAHAERKLNYSTPLEQAQSLERDDYLFYSKPARITQIKKIVNLLRDPSLVEKVVRKG